MVKNESGKSAILQALYKLNPIDEKAKYNSLYDYPKMYLTDYESGDIPNGSTVVISTWLMDSSEKEEFESKWGDNTLASDTIMISSGYTNKRQWIVSLNYDALFSAKMTDYKFTQSDYAHFQDKSTIAATRNELKAISSPSAP